MAALGRTFTVVDAFGSPGDSILTATVCRNLKRKFPRLRINCVTPNAGLLKHDPNIAEFNGPQRLPTVFEDDQKLASRSVISVGRATAPAGAGDGILTAKK